jgi:hypothetical protein
MNFAKSIGRSIGPIRRLHDNRNALAEALAAAEERIKDLEHQLVASRGTPFFAYFSNFDAVACMRRHEVQDRKPTPGFQTNWLGVLVDPKIYDFLADKAGTLESFPLPANWHADIAEWACALHAVELARRDSFIMIELGCGWGCWMNNAGVAAKRTGRRVHAIGIEADEGHIQFAREALARNGLAPDEYTLHRGIAAATDGTALFPRQEHPGYRWGLEPVDLAPVSRIP